MSLFRVVEGMHTPRTVILDLFDDFAGLVDKKHGFRSLFRREFGDFKQLVDTSQSFDVLLVAFLNRVLPLHDFAIDLFLVLIDQALIEFRLERAVAAFAFDNRNVGSGFLGRCSRYRFPDSAGAELLRKQGIPYRSNCFLYLRTGCYLRNDVPAFIHYLRRPDQLHLNRNSAPRVCFRGTFLISLDR